MSAVEYIKMISGSVVFSWIGKTVTLFPLLILITTLYSYRPKKMALLVVSAIIAFLQTIPIYIAYYFVMPNSLNIFVHALFITSCPFLVFIIYPLLKYYVQIPVNRCASISKKAIGYLNIPICMFLGVQELLLNKLKWKWESRVTIDNYASVVCIVITIVVFISAYAYFQHKNIRVKIPNNIRENRHQLFNAFLEVSIMYAALVLFRMLFSTSSDTTPYNVESAAIHYVSYLLLIIVWFGYLALEVYRDILTASKYEAENLMAHIAALDDANEQYHAIRHDINNMLQVYGSYLEMGDIERLKKYHQSIFKANADANLKVELSRKLGSYPPLYALLTTKEELAKSRGVNFDVSSSKVEPGLPIGDLELCRIVGNLLDNAIEAAGESVKKKVSITIESRENVVMFIVSNSCDQAINTKQIFARGYSTKGTDRGLGLFEVDKLVKKNGNIALSVNQHDNIVTCYLSIEYCRAKEDSYDEQ